MKPKVLICSDWFDPAYKAGGPITSIKNIIDHLYASYDFYVLCSAYDLHDNTPLVSSSELNTFIDYNAKAKVMYLSTSHIHYGFIKKTIQNLNPEVLYLNSLFSKSFTLYPLHLKFKGRVILAPRGMLGQASLAIKPLKKKLFISFSKAFGLYNNVVWQATSPQEKKDILSVFKTAKVILAPNLSINARKQSNKNKKPKDLSLLYVGRISPIKNLLGLLELLETLPLALQKKITLNIIGPKEDETYAQKCEKAAQKLNLKAFYFLGGWPAHKLSEAYTKASVYISSSLHENYGHSIAESLAHGTPVMASVHTPWKDLNSAKAGLCFDLNDKERFENYLTDIDQMSNEAYLELCQRAMDYYAQKTQTAKQKYISLLKG